MNNHPEKRNQCRLDWGCRGARRAADRGDILVIVDILSFSSLVATAVHRGGLIYPCRESDDLDKIAKSVGGEVAVSRSEVPEIGRFSLSPLTYAEINPETKIVVSSPNGATCCQYASQAPYLFAGCLLNARAVADAVSKVINGSDLSVAVIACGEREKEPNKNGLIRWAVEDYLGAGAILSYLQRKKSPDAVVCEAAFRNCIDSITEIIRDCPSGRELIELGFGEDIEHACRLNVYDCVPAMRDGHFTQFQG